MSITIFNLLLLIGLAASVNITDKKIDLNKCIINVPSSTYNLTLLDQEDHKILGRNDSSTMIISLCSGLKDPGCSGALLCLKQGQKASKIVKNKEGVSLYSLKNSLRLSYLGDICPQDNTTQQTLDVQLICSKNEREPVLKEHKNCTYSIQWETKSACANHKEDYMYLSNEKAKCEVVDQNGTVYDLSPLRNTHRNYFAINQAWDDTSGYAINLCGPLVKEKKVPCDGLKTGACRYVLDDNLIDTPESLGSLTPVKSNTPLTLVYLNGTECPFDDTMKMNYRIKFVCLPSSGKGVPIVLPITKEDCSTTFLWHTSYVCSKDVIDAYKDSVNRNGSCSYTDPFTKEEFDMSAFKKPSEKPFQVPSKTFKGQTYIINICGAVTENSKSRCSNSGFCRTGNDTEMSYGSYKEVGFSSKNRILTATYSHGDKCKNGTMEAKINFICDRKALYGKPVIKEEKECHIELDWRTIHTCATSKPQCNFISGRRSYNFTELSIAHEDWKVKDYNNNEMWVNLCGELNHEHGCDRDTVVCMKEKATNKTHSLGRYSDQYIRRHWTYGLQIIYGQGDSYCPGSSKNSSVEITFHCSEKTESVQYISPGSLASDCITKMSWKTPLACGGKLIDVPEAKDMIYDRIKKKAYNISSLVGIDIAIPGNPGSEYLINLRKGTKKPGCSGASVCLLDDLQEYNIGEWSTRQYLKKSAKAHITLSLTSKATCHENKNKQPRTYITLICSNKRDNNKVAMKYENKNCETFFEWMTVNVCDNTARNMTSAEWATYSKISTSSSNIIIVVVVILIVLIVGISAVVLYRSDRTRKYINNLTSRRSKGAESHELEETRRPNAV